MCCRSFSAPASDRLRWVEPGRGVTIHWQILTAARSSNETCCSHEGSFLNLPEALDACCTTPCWSQKPEGGRNPQWEMQLVRPTWLRKHHLRGGADSQPPWRGMYRWFQPKVNIERSFELIWTNTYCCVRAHRWDDIRTTRRSRAVWNELTLSMLHWLVDPTLRGCFGTRDQEKSALLNGGQIGLMPWNQVISHQKAHKIVANAQWKVFVQIGCTSIIYVQIMLPE